MKTATNNIESLYKSHFNDNFRKIIKKKITQMQQNITTRQHKVQLGGINLTTNNSHLKDKVIMLSQNKKNHVDIVCSFDNLSIHSNSFDLVVLPHTFEQNQNDDDILNETNRILSGHGFLIVIGFNLFSFFSFKNLFKKKQTKISYRPYPLFVLSKKLAKYNIIKKQVFMLNTKKRLFTSKKFADIYISLFQKNSIPVNPVKTEKEGFYNKNFNPSF
jgi:hypothetical protein